MYRTPVEEVPNPAEDGREIELSNINKKSDLLPLNLLIDKYNETNNYDNRKDLLKQIYLVKVHQIATMSEDQIEEEVVFLCRLTLK